MGNHGMTLFPLHLANKMLHHKWCSRGLVIASGPFRGAALTPRPPPWHWLSLPSIPPDTRSMCKMIGDSLVLGGTGFAYFPRGATWWNHSGRPRHERKSLMRYQKWQGVTTKLSRIGYFCLCTIRNCSMYKAVTWEHQRWEWEVIRRYFKTFLCDDITTIRQLSVRRQIEFLRAELAWQTEGG